MTDNHGDTAARAIEARRALLSATGRRVRREPVPWVTALALASIAAAGCSSTSNGSSSNGGDDSGSMGDDGAAAADDATIGTGDDGNAPSSSSGGGSGSSSSGGGSGSSSSGGGSGSSSGGDSGLPGDAGMTTLDGALASCITALWSTYVQRVDGVLLLEGTSEEPILDSTTGLPLAGVVNVQDSQHHGCAAISGGSAECWQTDTASGNTSGQLGNGTTTASSTLYRATVVVTAPNAPLTKVLAIAPGAGTNTACAVTTDGKLWCWGDLTWIVNQGTSLLTGYAQAITTDGMTPLTGVVQATVGPRQACALVQGTPNTVWCWGYNASGELAQGDTTARRYPTKVLGLTNPTKVALEPDYSGSDATVCAFDGGNVRCWGGNSYGAAGANSTTNPIQGPTLVVTQSGTALGGVVDLEPGNAAFSTLRSDGTLWRWGESNIASGSTYAENYGVTNVVGVGWSGGVNDAKGPRYLTVDGVYHNAMSAITVNCGAL